MFGQKAKQKGQNFQSKKAHQACDAEKVKKEKEMMS
jgi:hypothetical protein